MSTWASRRKRIIGWIVFLIFIVFVLGIYFIFFYKAPTCFDGIQNGGEFGVDCGGKCVKLCQSDYLPAKIVWGGGKFERVAEGRYNVAAYIANPNISAAAINVPYKFTLYDNRGIFITEKSGTLTIPARRNTIAFEPAIRTEKKIPAKVTFEFTSPPVWFKSSDKLGNLLVTDRKYSENETSSSLIVTFQNRALTPIYDVTVGAVLYDIDGNAIGFSRTKIDSIAAGGTEVAPFTWPFVRQGAVVTIEVLPVVSPEHK